MASTASVIEQLDNSPDVLTWLNTVLDVPGDITSSDPPLVTHASTLDALQTATSIAAQSTSATLERIIDDIARAAPRLVYDIHFTRDSALALRNVLAQTLPLSHSRRSAQTTVDSAEPDATSKVLGRLQHLDTLRVRMEAARDVLREAESWSALETEVTTLLAEKAYARAASRLSASARLMPVSARTVTTPGPSAGMHEPRRALLTSLANQLEAALSPDLVRAVTACDVESCKSFYAIFVDIEREGEFRNYYYGTRRSSIVEAWSKAVIEGERGSSGGADKEAQSLIAFYPVFLSSFLTVLKGERTALPNIFPDPERTLATLIYTTLSVLTPPPAQRLAALFQNGSSATALKDIVKLFQASEEFARGTERILEKLRASAPPLLTPPSSSSPGEGRHSRRRSVRMSMSWRSMTSTGRLGGGGVGSTTNGSADEGAEWDQCLFQPFLDFQVDFGTLERRLLDETLGSPLPGNIRDLDGDRAARAMRERAVDVFSAAEESIERCLEFTHGYASVGLVRALDGFMGTFVETWTNSISNLVGAESRSVTSKPAASAAVLEDEELADLDYTSHDWAHIQKALHLLAAGRAVKDRLGMFETRLMTSLRQVSAVFRTAWGSGGSGVHTPGVTKGQGLLLAQSSLNSMELRDLLVRVAHSGSTKPPPSLLMGVHNALTAFARANQRTLQRVLLSPLYVHLATYPTLPLWSAARVQDAVPGMAGVVVPTFSLSPSEVAHRVGDGLLNLPRLFEVYAEDDALGFELGGLTAADGGRTETTTTAMGAEETDERGQGQVHSPEAVTAAWLSSLGRATVVHLTRDVLPQIKTLSVAGAAQLSADLGYLETIARALGVEKSDLERWKELVGMTDEEGRAALASDDGTDKIGQMVARMRKWSR